MPLTFNLIRSNIESIAHGFDLLTQGISIVSSDLVMIYANRRFYELLGLPADKLPVGSPFEAFIRYNAEHGEYGPGDVDTQVRERMALARKFEPHRFERTKKDGTTLLIEGTPLSVGGFVTTYTDVTAYRKAEAQLRDLNEALERGLVESTAMQAQMEEQAAQLASVAEDQYSLNQRLQHEISERQRAEERMRHMAQHDALTGLPNRRLFFELVDKSLAAAQRDRQTSAILYLDIDGFKAVNDTMGHAMGDELLCKISDRISNRLRRSDIVARIGGDEFVALVRNLPSTAQTEEIADDIVRLISEPFQLKDGVANVGVSIGIAVYPIHGDGAEELLSAADAAMYRAKKNGKNQFRVAEPA